MSEPQPIAQDPPPAAARIGEVLRAARLAGGGDLGEIGRALCIKPEFLKAIEDNDGGKLPAPVYALGFVRSYADYLGFDGAEAARRFKAESYANETKFDLALPMAVPDRGLPTGMILLVGLIIAACAYGIWYYLGSAERRRPERVAAVPTELLPPPAAESKAAPEPPPPAEPLPAPGAFQPSALQPFAVPAPAAPPPFAAGTPPAAPPPSPLPGLASPQPAPPQPAASEPAPPQQPAGPEAAVPQAGRVFGATEGPSRIVITASADSWIQVLDRDKRVLLQRTLHPGDTYRVPVQPGLRLRAGNAGGLNLSVDGRPIAPIGKPGKFRSLALDPEALGGKGGAGE